MFGFGKETAEKKVEKLCENVALKSFSGMIDHLEAKHGKGAIWVLVNGKVFNNSIFFSYMNGWFLGYLKRCGVLERDMQKYWTQFLYKTIGPILSVYHQKFGADAPEREFDIANAAAMAMRRDDNNIMAFEAGIRDGSRASKELLDWERYGNPPSGTNLIEWIFDQTDTKFSMTLAMMLTEYKINGNVLMGKVLKELDLL
jgi:hypothetical protein